MQTVKANTSDAGKVNWRKVTRAIRRSYEDCVAMYNMLTDYKKLGKTTVVMESGVRITKCPPAYAHGIGLGNATAKATKSH